ncbi:MULTISPECIES: argininosuccinate lyase [unclassified Sulfurospirillum]|uniref:argininosuccinate lyase n=1 Tax=unclassified Sulfurospirillum TaxID=2618290 RepID=UPI000543781A|nr:MULTISPECIES: argininosuccinate lyase [unclassified Sulfurospirillum]KHG35269.1 MAG: argininosuccinate lyase [Sulfurospirillum sp. MES]MCP3651867.1 argininosuccinate lyase [Sulfurospirillum sp. DNRA8]MCR1810714.1 argininosuccinate lyase [Sulfurospirillum sp. DNRA8]
MSKLWSGRFAQSGTQLLDEFNASLPFDKKLYEEDIRGSIAHATMLAKQGILSGEEADQIAKGLMQIKQEIDEGKFEFNIAHEDIHMSVETRLIDLIGEAGKRLHTARSRNDQVAVDFRQYVQKQTLMIVHVLESVIDVLMQIAKEHTTTLLPGMTHLQHAQPINLAFHLLAYVSMFKRDIERLESSYTRNNVLPLGCAALAGTPHPIDREYVAKLLGFDSVSVNCLDTVSDRDFALEILFNVATLMMHVSRFAEELILWSSYEFKFITLSDAYSTGSSIMPQKKNPDVPELLRGKTGRVNGNLIALLTVLKGLPLAYNKDMQEDKEGVFDSVETALISLNILREALRTMTINTDRMRKACEVGHLSATDLADYLVQKCNIPFREAHFITGRAVAHAESLGKDLSVLSVRELQSVDARIGEDVCAYLSLEHSMNARTSQGGTSVASTQRQIEIFEAWINARKA